MDNRNACKNYVWETRPVLSKGNGRTCVIGEGNQGNTAYTVDPLYPNSLVYRYNTAKECEAAVKEHNACLQVRNLLLKKHEPREWRDEYNRQASI